jgi:hypothetical protein
LYDLADQDWTKLLSGLMVPVPPSERNNAGLLLRRICKSLDRLAIDLISQGDCIWPTVMRMLLKGKTLYMWTKNKSLKGSSCPDREAQFTHISQGVSVTLAMG